MDWQTEVKLLGMKKTRRDAMKQLLNQAQEKCQKLEISGTQSAMIREKLNIAKLTADITRLNDEIFVLAQKLGIDPETGEIIDAGRDYAAPTC